MCLVSGAASYCCSDVVVWRTILMTFGAVVTMRRAHVVHFATAYCCNLLCVELGTPRVFGCIGFGLGCSEVGLGWWVGACKLIKGDKYVLESITYILPFIHICD